MFVQIHMLQSLPPGNLNRDDTGQPKKCTFGGVTRGRISSQCLKRNIRRSEQFGEYLDGSSLRSMHLPRLLSEALRNVDGFDEGEATVLAEELNRKFKSEKKTSNADPGPEETTKYAPTDGDLLTKQLVFFTQAFVQEMAEMIRNERSADAVKTKKARKDFYKRFFDKHQAPIRKASEKLTPDIALFGRMTTSDLLVDVEATCQVAHAISTHETLIEGDYFTAMDDLAEGPGAAFMGTRDTVTFFDSAVYYKYMNIDVDALRDEEHLTEAFSADDAAELAGNFIRAAATRNPTGKQNSFAAHGLPEYILVELSQTKQPISYANAFLQPIEGENLMTSSAEAMGTYVGSIAKAYAPADTQRIAMRVGHAGDVGPIDGATETKTLDDLCEAVKSQVLEA
jgi:CRISPR system Cascade subunit CasC